MASKLRTMRRARAVDGEAFAVLTSNSQLKSPIKLDVRLIEADQVTDPSGESNNADGIKFDDAGNPISYSILKEHPGGRGMVLTSSNLVPPTPARDVIHWFTADRPGQVRGIPEITPALPLFGLLRRYALTARGAIWVRRDTKHRLSDHFPSSRKDAATF